MSKTGLLLFILGSIGLLAVSCEKEIPPIPDEVELITTVTYTLTPEGGGTPIVFRFEDLDGDGGNAPNIAGATIDAKTTYDGALTLLNEQESPAEDITEEIAEEDLEHQFFFQSDLAGLTVQYADSDSLGNPVGLATKIAGTTAGSDTLIIILRHEPNKSGSGVAEGDITNAGGETDIEVKFPITVR
ncbi:MAG: type 1 periplasmic binding fold superfamily protein [Bacteroidia bacterium]